MPALDMRNYDICATALGWFDELVYMCVARYPQQLYDCLMEQSAYADLPWMCPL